MKRVLVPENTRAIIKQLDNQKLASRKNSNFVVSGLSAVQLVVKRC